MKVTQDYGWVEAVEASPETWQYMAKQAERTTITEVIYTQVPFGRTFRFEARKVIRTRRPDEMGRSHVVERIEPDRPR